MDDEQEIRDLIGRALGNAGYRADITGDGEVGLAWASAHDYGLVVLDLVMPDMDGRVFLAQLHAVHPDPPAVLVLSCVSDVATKVSCLELGAQDYLTKPFSLAELLARVRVQLRDVHPRGATIRAGGLVLDIWRLNADIGGGPVALTRLEFLLLRELAEHAGQPLRKEELLASIWGLDFDPGSNVVDVCVRRLRSKLGFDLIKTVRGAGYQLTS